jgi:DNA-directed RNA polymerase subunit RPC12/RpoP
MKSIEEHQAEILHLRKNKYHTGIQCPYCGNELQYKDDTVMLSYPPQKEVIRFNCRYTDRVYV